MRSRLLLSACLLLVVPLLVRAQAPDKAQLAVKARDVLTRHCYRCHGQNSAAEGGFNYVLDVKRLLERKIVPGDPAKSPLFRKMGINQSMPPEEVKVRPTADEIAVVRQWIEAGAPVPPADTAKPRPFITLKDELTAMRDYLRKKDRDDRPNIRFFTLRQLSNLPPDNVRDADLRIYRAALSKLVNSLSWKERIVVPEAADAGQTVYAVDISKLDWQRDNLWQEILKAYPYALSHTQYPADKDINDLADEVYGMAGTKVPIVRADWFIATASRPPLYHTLLQIPENARDLEKRLKVNVEENIREGNVKRAGFNGSGVSSHNRLVERHESDFGAYWKSYDFKSSAALGNLFVYPLGPRFKGNPFDNKHAFQHAGGEIIFHLPNHLQGYMLVNAKDERINEGPVEIVSDSTKVSGTPLVINGLSCMRCHDHGMRTFEDQIRSGHILGGKAREFVEKIYPEKKDMEAAVEEDRAKFLTALNKAAGPFLKIGADASKDAADFPEPIAAIAQWYLVQELTAAEAAAELGLDKPDRLIAAVENNMDLQKAGLFPLARGHKVKREVWENTEFVYSPFQQAAEALKLGTPKADR